MDVGGVMYRAQANETGAVWVFISWSKRRGGWLGFVEKEEEGAAKL